MGSPFGNPAEIMKKLAAHPETKEWLKDPAYMQMLMTLQQNPQNIMQYMSDPRMMKTFSVMTGLDLGAMAGGPPNAGGKSEEMETEPMPTFDHSDQPKQAENSTTHNLNDMMEDDISDDDMETQDPAVEEAKLQKEREAMAENEKASGTAAYKKRDFELAHKHYAKSFEIDPKNMVYLLNTAAVYLEEKKFEECRKTCEKAVEVGRENRSDFKMIAKALARIGTSYEKEQNTEASMIWFNKSLAEFRDKTIMEKVKKMKKKAEEAKRRSYFSEEKFLESKGLGNECFKKADFPGGVANYNDALKRKDDQDKANHADLAVIYCNRAACYTKLMEFSLAVTDCDKAIKFNPDFIKGYLRKGTALEAMRKPTEAKKAFELALAKDSTSTEAQNGLQRVYQKSFEERNDPEKVRERVAKDPEVREIMSDPSMRLILEQMQQNPNALKDHLQNPDISAKIQKLIDVGIISLGQR
jgi:stress-induced-phosphoprotein 1